jgi:hypothetical protein
MYCNKKVVLYTVYIRVYNIAISNKYRRIRTCTITTTLSLRHSDTFQPSKGHPQRVRLIHFNGKDKHVIYQM